MGVFCNKEGDGGPMDCNEVVKKIKNFINGEMESREILLFTEHIANCPHCKEELSIEFLVVEGLKKLDSAAAFDLQKELDELIETSIRDAEQQMQRKRVLIWFGIFLAVAFGYVISTFFY